MVTLVCGLTVGFFIVLLMVPSPIVIQSDPARALNSLRRLVTGTRVPAIRAPVPAISQRAATNPPVTTAKSAARSGATPRAIG